MKRFFDCALVLMMAPIWVPFLLILVLCVWVGMGRPVFFTQERPGLHGRIFKIIKLRTMKDARAPDGSLLSDGERLTRFGKFLRAVSLDELPELINVLKGDMSLVGPRPLRVEYLPLYSLEQARRHEVRPGITGWAQVNGRNAITWEEKFTMDVWYVDHQTLGLDLKILFLTLWQVVSREGINAPGEATMPFFRGSVLVDKEPPEKDTLRS
ncbi:MAG TPA: sugar transferase [Opitutae bacterium]|nr:sugar transferase [Opitutae bacterium]